MSDNKKRRIKHYIQANKGFSALVNFVVAASVLIGLGLFALSVVLFVGVIVMPVASSVLLFGMSVGALVFGGTMIALNIKDRKEYNKEARMISEYLQEDANKFEQLQSEFLKHEKLEDTLWSNILTKGDEEIILAVQQIDLNNITRGESMKISKMLESTLLGKG